MGDAHRVVILGGGFGGLLAAKALKSAPVSVTLVDRRNFHLFQPLLYQVATGSLSPGDVAAPLRGVLSRQENTRVLLGEAVDLDLDKRQVILRDGEHLPYDSLIVATGSQTSYFGNEGWRKWSPSLKTVEEATEIRHKILFAFEGAERAHTPEKRRAWLTFVIVGAGPTGVELAGALAEIARHTLKHDFRSIRPEESQILILDGSPRVLSNYPEDLSEKAERTLVRLGVRVRSNTRVTDIDAEGLTYRTADGSTERLQSRTVLWAGGVRASEFAKTLANRLHMELDRAGRIRVQPDLTVPGHPDIYIVGDMALANGPNGHPLPGVSQVAMQEGKFAAKAIIKRLAGPADVGSFQYFDKGDMAVIGRGAAVANIFGWHLSGPIAWLIWLFIHLMYLVNFQNRLIVFIHWGFQYLTFSRGSRLITGLPPAMADEGELASHPEFHV
jgi:NADH:ubiquinone reductase (H+-translocating)